ncbi:MAG: AzlD domain-containing protein [Anaerolineaceae bacterium]|jgi:branched-subunit amino acid transport protein|nr:AzlD domain-containing protein [Anaerolineaceae bacterium]
MAETNVLITLVGMALVTYLPRLIPAWVLRDKQLPAFLVAWLRYVPVAVLAALLLPSLLIENNQINFSASNLYLWAAIPAGWVAWKKKSLFGTVIVGMLVVALVRWIIR